MSPTTAAIPGGLSCKQPAIACVPRQTWRLSVRRKSYVSSSAYSSSIAETAQRNVELFYTKAWGHAELELLPSLCSKPVTYSDARGRECDAYGCQGLADVISNCCSSHPLLNMQLDSIAVDASGRTAVAEWHAIAAHLLPGRSQLPPTGLVSEIWGLDQITFDDEGKISSILSFRDAFAEERAAEGGTQRFTGADAQTSSMD